MTTEPRELPEVLGQIRWPNEIMWNDEQKAKQGWLAIISHRDLQTLAQSRAQDSGGEAFVIDAELDDLILRYGNAREAGRRDEAATLYTEISCRDRTAAEQPANPSLDERAKLAGFDDAADAIRHIEIAAGRAEQPAKGQAVDLQWKLPCDVAVAPATIIRKGVPLSLLLSSIKLRETWEDVPEVDREAFRKAFGIAPQPSDTADAMCKHCGNTGIIDESDDGQHATLCAEHQPSPAQRPDGDAKQWLHAIHIALREVPHPSQDDKWHAAQDALSELRAILSTPPSAELQAGVVELATKYGVKSARPINAREETIDVWKFTEQGLRDFVAAFSPAQAGVVDDIATRWDRVATELESLRQPGMASSARGFAIVTRMTGSALAPATGEGNVNGR